MPQIQVGSPNINTFSFSLAFDIANRRCIFTDTSSYNNTSNQGVLFVQGIAFSLIDSDGVELASIDWDNPQLPTPATQPVYTLDLSSIGFPFLFQRYTIVGSIKDQNGNIYTTQPVYKTVGQPVGFTESGYVNGIFKITPNIPNNTLSVSEVTPFVYNSKTPNLITKSGTLSYPTGTISPISFTGTPFSNNVVFSGQYRIANTSIASYDLEDAVSVLISYYTNNYFDVITGSKMADLSCCLEQVQDTAIKRCTDAVGQQAKQKLADISSAYMLGISNEISGKDSSAQYEYIKKYLKCDCGATSLQQNEVNPINPSSTSIIVTGINGTTVTPSTNGNTSNFIVSSNVYQVVKGDTGDLAFTISTDNRTSGVVKTIITFNYTVMAGYLLSAINGNDSLMAQLNALITFSNYTIDLNNLNGKCVIDISSTDYLLSYKVPSGAVLFKNITINGTLHTAPTGLVVSGTDAITAYLNSLSLGAFDVIYSNSMTGSYFSILSAPNANTLNSVTLTISSVDTSVPFQSTNKSIVAVLQAIIDYLCGLTTLQLALGSAVSLGYFDYNGSLVYNTYGTTNTQNDFNAGVSNSIQNIINRINALTTVTCARLQALFQDYPSAVFDITNDRIMSIVAGNCTSLNARQFSLAVISAINSNSDVKAAFCGIVCTTPDMCPAIASFNLNVYGFSLAIYSIAWGVTPNVAQTVTVNYRVQGASSWITATTGLIILPNGNISGVSPYLLPLFTSHNTSYEVQVINNCSGLGVINQVRTPTTPVYANTFRLTNVEYLGCGATPITLYSNSPFAQGAFMYYDIALSSNVLGYTYIISPIGDVYAISSGSGQVFYYQGYNCNNGTPNNYILGNNSSTICGNPTYVLYTKGGFAVGRTVYYDGSLITPVSASYIVFNGIIYNLSSGVIGSAVGSTCSNNTTLTLTYSRGTFAGNLSNAVPFDVLISSMNIQGSSGSSCSSPSETDSLANMTLVSGGNNINFVSNGLTCASTRFTVNNSVTVNGNVLSNGGTAVISGITFNIVILNVSCSVYTC